MQSESHAVRFDIKRILSNNTAFAYILMVLLFLVASLVLPGFLKLSNIHNVLRLASFLGLVTIGQTVVILSSGIDLSVGAVMTFSDIMVGQLVFHGMNGWAAIIVVLAASVLIGSFNALGITLLNIPPLVMTFAMGFILDGAELVFTGGTPQGKIPDLLINIATDSILGIPYIAVLWIVLGAIVSVVLAKTIFGQQVYAIGTQRTVARLVGINIPKIEISMYVISAFMASIAGLLLAGYSGSAYLGAGDPYTLESVAAVVIGGTSILGGSGSYVGTFAGTIIFTVLTAALTVTNVSEAGKLLMEGVLIIVLLLIYQNRKSRSAY